MRRPTIALSLALVLVTGGASSVIWRQYKRIEELSARNTEFAATSARLRQKLAAVPQAPPRVASARSAETAAPDTATEDPNTDSTSPQDRRNAFRQRGAERFAELLANPEIASLLLSQRKAMLDTRYAALFKQLGLTPEETEKLKTLLAERQMGRMETGAVARAEGVSRSDGDTMRDLMKQSDQESDAQLQALLGPDRYNTLKTYEQTATQRSQVSQFATRLSYTAAPLQQYQSDAMVQVLAANPPPQAPGWGASEDETAAYLKNLQDYNAQIYSRSSTILSPDKLTALQQMQQEVVDRAKLATLVGRRFGGGGGGGGFRGGNGGGGGSGGPP